jgi:hypothetical protein
MQTINISALDLNLLLVFEAAFKDHNLTVAGTRLLCLITGSRQDGQPVP